MVPLARRVRLILLLALPVCALPGCFGGTQNPSYFPYLLPTGDIIRTHAKPIGPGYYADFDPNAVRLEVRPLQAVNPVQTQHVLIATVYDAKGQPRRARRVEWMIEGVGNIVEVDESGVAPGRGWKDGNKYAVSYTSYHEHRIDRGNQDPRDDFMVRPGQTWCVLTSAREGDTYVTVWAPGIHNWEKSKVFVNARWVDAGWEFPPPAVARFGTEHVFTTKIFRHTDKQPLSNYKVRYKIIDGPPAFFLPGRTTETVVVSDLSGNAQATIAQAAPRSGVNRVSVEIIRPPDPSSPGGVGIVLARGETAIEWLAPEMALAHDGPPSVPVGGEATYSTRVTNAGKVESQFMTVTVPVPDGLRYLRSQPPAATDGRNLVWTLPVLPPGQTHSVQSTFQAERAGPVTSCATVETAEGFKAEKCVTTTVTQPQLNLSLTGPPAGVVGVPIDFQVTLVNPGSGPTGNVQLTATYDPALKHVDPKTGQETPGNTLTVVLQPLGPLETRVVPLRLTPTAPGKWTVRVNAVSDALKGQAEHTVVVSQPQLSLSLHGPRTKYADRPVEWDITVANAGDTPIDNVVVRDRLPPELTFEGATQGGVVRDGEVIWTLGTLKPGDRRVVQVITRTPKLPAKVTHTVVATADPGLRREAKAELDVLGLPALRLEAIDRGDPVEVGKQVTYEVEVTNTGSLPANEMQIRALLPPELRPLAGNGPTAAKVEKQEVTFEPVKALQPNQTVKYVIEAQAVKGGDVRFRVELRSLALQQPVIEEESTTVVDPAAPLAPAAPPGGNVPAAPPGGNVPAAPPGPPPAAPPGAAAVPPVPPPPAPPPK